MLADMMHLKCRFFLSMLGFIIQSDVFSVITCLVTTILTHRLVYLQILNGCMAHKHYFLTTVSFFETIVPLCRCVVLEENLHIFFGIL